MHIWVNTALLSPRLYFCSMWITCWLWHGWDGLRRSCRGTVKNSGDAGMLCVCKEGTTLHPESWIPGVWPSRRKEISVHAKEATLGISMPMTKRRIRNSRGWQGTADSGFWDLLKLPNLCMRWQGLEGKSPWTESEDKALLLTPAPTLAMPDVAKPFYLSVDEKKTMAKVVLINSETWALALSCGLLTREIRSSGWWASLLENYCSHCPTN